LGIYQLANYAKGNIEWRFIL